jgi:hypothetical protein
MKVHASAALARFSRPGHRAEGRRSEESRNRGAGYVFLHAAVDDRSRYAYVEGHPDERAEAAGPSCAGRSPTFAPSASRRRRR